jgi:hypothetical protein
MNRNPTFINWCANIRAKNIAKSLPHPHPVISQRKNFQRKSRYGFGQQNITL